MLDNLSTLIRGGAVESGSLGVSVNEQGISICQIDREQKGKPALRICSYRPSDTQSDVSMLMRSMMTELNIENIPCNFVLSPSNYQLLLIEAPDVQDQELKAAVRWQIRDMIDFHVDDAAIDVFDIPHQNAQIRNRMMYVVVCRSAWISQTAAIFERAAAPLEVIDIAELALRNVVSLVEENDEGVMMMHLSEDSGLLMVIRQSTLFLTRKIKIGSRDLIRAAGEEAKDGVLSADLRHLLDVMVLEVQRSLDYYESHFSQPSVATIYLGPMPQEMPSTASYLSESLELPVRALDLNALLDCPDTLSVEHQYHCLSAVGAALREERTSL